MHRTLRYFAAAGDIFSVLMAPLLAASSAATPLRCNMHILPQLH
jgi:hypothetical protein